MITTKENVIETVKIDKYIFTIYKRDNPRAFSDCPFAVLYEKETPKGKWSKTKMLNHYVYKTYEECEEYVTKVYGEIYRTLKARAKRKEEKKEAQKNLDAKKLFNTGDIVYNSWGYEQTNIDFYQVIRVTKKTIIVKPISSEIIQDSIYSHGMAYDVKAVKDSFIEGGKDKRLTVRPGGCLSTPGRESGCYSKWDGRPKYVSTYY